MISILNLFLSKNKAEIYAILVKIYSATSGLLITVLVANYYSEINQGYYYSYIAAQAIIIFVELGLSNVLTIFASHESAKLKFNSKKILYGDRQALGRIKSLGKQSFKWYSISSIVITIVFLALGYLNFNTNLAGSWIALSVVYGLSLIPTPIMAILDGCNQIKNTNKYRLIATIFSSLIGMAAIVIGMNLWVPAIMFGTNIIIVALCLFINYKYFIVQIIFKPKKYDLEINWWKEVIPMQWKIALSCLSGYFAYSIMVPITLAYQGAEIAGKLGMSLSIISGIIGIALSITIPKASQFGGLIADHQYYEANRVLRRLIINALIITTLLSLGFTILYEILAYYNYKFIGRLLPIELFILLLISTIISSSVMPIGYYLRSYKKEPLLILSIVTGLLTGISIYISNRYLNIYYVIYSYVLLTVITSLCVPIILYMHNYNIARK